MFFASDNAGPAHPKVVEAIAAANAGYAPSYGADPLTARAIDKVRDVFEAPDAHVEFVATGTGCNSLILGALARPWQTVFVGPLAHVQTDEANAIEFQTGGAKVVPVGAPGEDGLGTLRQGYLEESSVDAVREVTELIEAQRGYEMNAKVISAADQMMAATTQVR